MFIQTYIKRTYLVNHMNLDKLLESQSSELFKLDPLSWKILEIFTEKGKQTVYSLGRELHGQSRSTIHRRFEGSNRFIGLEKESFIVNYLNTPYRTGDHKYKKYYYLEFKGFLASLKFTKLERHSLFKLAIDGVEKYLSPDLVPLFIEYVKAELALWFQSHIENGLGLTHIKIPHLYYHQTKHSEKIFGDISNAHEPVLPEIFLDPSNDDPVEAENWKYTYSDTWVKLIKIKKEKEEAITKKLSEFDETQQNLVWRWNETMILMYWWRQRQEGLNSITPLFSAS
jgi:hypothetical protein